MTGTSGSSGTPSIVEKSPLDFSNKDPPLLITERIGMEEQGQDELSHGIAPVGNPSYTEVAPEPDLEKETVAMGAFVNKRRRKRARVRRKQMHHPISSRKAVVMKDLNSKKSTSFTSMVGSPGSHDDLASHVDLAEMEMLVVDDMSQNVKFADGSHADKDTNMLACSCKSFFLKQKFQLSVYIISSNVKKDIAEAKNVELVKELESLRVQFSDLQVSNHQLSQQVSTLHVQVTGEERIKNAFEEFKKYEDDRVSSRCAKIDARLDVMSIYFDEELYPHMLTAIAGRRWVIGHGLCLAIVKYAESIELRLVFADVVSAGIAKGKSEGLKHGVEHRKGKVDLAAIEAYDPEANTKYVAALHALKDLKYPLVDQQEKLKDAHIDVIMSSLYLKSDSGEDAPYPKDPWSFKEEILLEDAIAADIRHAKSKKKCRVVCRTHGVGFAHHARSDGIPVSVPTVASQGLSILLADAATQTNITEDDASPKLLRSKSLPPMYNLDWP
nr:hypothetical protein [Tanacetum cinerariifolium]